MIECISNHTPYDDEPDPLEEAERWLKRNPEDPTNLAQCHLNYAHTVISMLLAYVKDEI